jgi:hypothetical protein
MRSILFVKNLIFMLQIFFSAHSFLNGRLKVILYSYFTIEITICSNIVIRGCKDFLRKCNMNSTSLPLVLGVSFTLIVLKCKIFAQRISKKFRTKFFKNLRYLIVCQIPVFRILSSFFQDKDI